MEDLEEFDWIACNNNACKSTSLPPALSHAVKIRDPSLDEIGDPANLTNYLPDSGATQHMTPHREDLYEAVEGQNLGVEVADGHIIRCSTTGKVKISMLDDNCKDACMSQASVGAYSPLPNSLLMDTGQLLQKTR